MWNGAVFLSLVPHAETAFHSLIVSSLRARCFPKNQTFVLKWWGMQTAPTWLLAQVKPMTAAAARAKKKITSQQRVWQVCHNLPVGGKRWEPRKINAVPWKNEKKKNTVHHRVQQAEGVIFVKGYYFYFSHGGVWRKPTQDTKVSQEIEAGQE